MTTIIANLFSHSAGMAEIGEPTRSVSVMISRKYVRVLPAAGNGLADVATIDW